MAKTRIKVEVSYLNKKELNLIDVATGDVFQTIREGEPFRIDNQMRAWVPVRVPRHDGKGSILECRKYGDGGNVIERFALPNHKVGLWALTSGAARNGVFHKSHEPDMVRALAIFLGKPYMTHLVKKEDGGNITTPILYRNNLYAVYHDGEGEEVEVDLATYEVSEVYGPLDCLQFTGKSYVYVEGVDYEDEAWYTAAGTRKAFAHMVKSFRMTDSQLEAFAEEYPQYAEAALQNRPAGR